MSGSGPAATRALHYKWRELDVDKGTGEHRWDVDKFMNMATAAVVDYVFGLYVMGQYETFLAM